MSAVSSFKVYTKLHKKMPNSVRQGPMSKYKITRKDAK